MVDQPVSSKRPSTQPKATTTVKASIRRDTQELQQQFAKPFPVSVKAETVPQYTVPSYPNRGEVRQEIQTQQHIEMQNRNPPPLPVPTQVTTTLTEQSIPTFQKPKQSWRTPKGPTFSDTSDEQPLIPENIDASPYGYSLVQSQRLQDLGTDLQTNSQIPLENRQTFATNNEQQPFPSVPPLTVNKSAHESFGVPENQQINYQGSRSGSMVSSSHPNEDVMETETGFSYINPTEATTSIQESMDRQTDEAREFANDIVEQANEQRRIDAMQPMQTSDRAEPTTMIYLHEPMKSKTVRINDPIAHITGGEGASRPPQTTSQTIPTAPPIVPRGSREDTRSTFDDYLGTQPVKQSQPSVTFHMGNPHEQQSNIQRPPLPKEIRAPQLQSSLPESREQTGSRIVYGTQNKITTTIRRTSNAFYTIT